VVSREVLPPDRSQREQLAEWEAALAASGLPVAGLDAERPKSRLVIAAPLANGIPGEAELVDIWLVERVPRWRAREALEGRLPAGYTLVDLYDVWLGEPPAPGRVAASVYRARVAEVDTARLATAANALLGAASLPRDRRKGEGTVAYDLRPFLGSVEVAAGTGGGAIIRMTLLHDPARGIGRPDEALAALGEAVDGAPLQAESLVRERLVVADPAPPSPPVPRAPRGHPPERPTAAARGQGLAGRATGGR
jgi:Uncharacterized protein conserved in bacteria (DUF2344)